MRGRKPQGRPESLRQVAVRGANVKPRLATGRSPTLSVKARLIAGLSERRNRHVEPIAYATKIGCLFGRGASQAH
jgi:hypothetical protein